MRRKRKQTKEERRKSEQETIEEMLKRLDERDKRKQRD